MPHLLTNMHSAMFRARANTNNLPLALVPIRHKPESEGSHMTFVLIYRQLFCQWICYIVFACNLADLDITTLYDLPDQVVPPEYVFGLRM